MRLERIDAAGILHRVAGGEFKPVVLEGAVNGLSGLRQITVGPDGAVYGWLLGTASAVVRIQDGQISRVAGGELTCSPGQPFCGIGGPARAASFGNPSGIAFGRRGEIFIASNDGSSSSAGLGIIRPTFPLPSGADSAVASADGSEIYAFDGEGKHLRTLDATTSTVLETMHYDAFGRIVGITDRDGLLTTIQRAPDGTATAIVSPYGQRTELTLGPDGYLSRITDANGGHYDMTYVDGLLTSFTNRNGHTSLLTYDPQGLLTRDTDAGGGYTNLAKSDLPGGRRITKTSALGRTWLLDTTYDAVNRQTYQLTDPAGLIFKSIDDPGGTVTQTTADGTITRTTQRPDPRFGMTAPVTVTTETTPGGLVRTTESSRSVVQASADDPFHLLQRTDIDKVNGRAWTRVYDVATDVETITSPAGRTSQQKFDAVGHLLEIDVPGVLPITFDYDANGRVVGTTQGTRVSTQTYGADGWLATSTDPLGRTTSLTRDPVGRVLSEVRPDLAETSFAYDPDGNTTQVVPPGKPAHDFTFDAREQLASYEPPVLASGATPTDYGYNLDKQPTQVAQPGPRLIDYQYDAAGRLTSTTFPLGSITRTYDSAGRLATLAGPTGVTMSYGYDGSLLKTMGWTGAITGSVERTFDNDFRVVGETVNGAWPVAFGYDADSLLTSAGGLQLFRDPLNGRLTGTQIGQITDSYTYDAFGQVATYSASFGLTPLLSFAYVRDDLGRIVTKTETEGGVSKVFGYSYDEVGRLIEVTENGVVTESYEYDLNGNRTQSFNSAGSFVATFDDQDRILTYGTLAFTWTPNGEMASKTDTATGEVTTYSYDALGNLREVVLPDGTDITYLVDGQGRRVGKVVNGVFERGWLWRGQLQPVAELDATGVVSKRFVYVEGLNAPDLVVAAGTRYRLAKDHLGSIREIVDEGSGSVVDARAYDAWGFGGASTGDAEHTFGFAGGMRDESTSVVRLGARDYDPQWGGWLSADPVHFSSGGTNLRQYADSDPVNLVDVTGHSAVGPDEMPEKCSDCKEWAKRQYVKCNAERCKGCGPTFADCERCAEGCRSGQDYDEGTCLRKCRSRKRPKPPEMCPWPPGNSSDGGTSEDE